MIIENTDAFYSWLMSCLGRLCDADPAALAKYVMALVKKDKPENELKIFCTDQLDVFLTKQTQSFVDLLFETLRTKSYLQGSALPLPSNSLHMIEGSVNPAFNGSCSAIKTVAPSTVPLAETFPVTSPIKSDKTEKKKELHPDIDAREGRRGGFPHRSRSSSSSGSSKRSVRCRSRSRSRENEERDKRRRRVSEDERRRRQLQSRRYENRRRSSRNRRPSDSSDRTDRNERERDREIRRERSGVSLNDRQRSRSPARSRSDSWEHPRSRSRSSSWSSCSRSRSWSRSREHSKEHVCPDSRSSRNRGNTPDRQSDHGDTDYRVGAGAPKSSSPSVPRVTDPNKKKHGGRVAKRCKDYDEKGYCMRGDLCVYDHGTDPLVVEDVSVLNFGAPTAAATVTANPGCVLPPMIIHQQGAGAESPLPPLPPSSPPPPPPPPPVPPGTFAPEPYNPEAPGIYRGKRDQVVPFLSPSVPPPHHAPGPSHSSGPPMPLPSRIAGVPPFNPNEPPPGFLINPKLQRTRELIGVPTLDSDRVEASSTGVDLQDPNLQQAVAMQHSQSSVTHVTNVMSSVAIPGGSFKRKQFDYNRLGVKKPVKRNSERCTLELRKIPRHLNTVCLLDKHFSRFGPIKAILTCYNNDPEAALVEYTTHTAATAAYRNSEAVLNNRFIKVFWHYKDSGTTNVPLTSLSDTSEVSVNADETVASSNKQQVAQEPVTESLNNYGLSDVNTTSNKSELESERAVVFSQKGGSISRTVFNPAAMKKSNVTLPPTTAVRKCKEEQRKEAIKKKLELHKKKQTFLQSHVENQKMLIDKLAKSKNEKEKEFLKKTIEDLSVKILDLQAELKKEFEVLSSVMKTVNGKFVANKTEAERELLDAEMDLYNKQHRGDDVTELLYKVNELKQQAMGLLEGSIQRTRGVRGGRMMRGRGRGRNLMFTRSIDHRPRKILVMNTGNIDKEALRNHFLQFGEVENFEASDVGAFVTYRTRKEAETAFVLASKGSNQSIPVHNLSFAWCHDSAASDLSTKSDLSMSSVGSDRESQQNQLLEEEEEEEEEEDEDSEARSWRR